MRKLTTPCPECSQPLYLRSVSLGKGRRLVTLACEGAEGCGWREETVEHEEA